MSLLKEGQETVSLWARTITVLTRARTLSNSRGCRWAEASMTPTSAKGIKGVDEAKAAGVATMIGLAALTISPYSRCSRCMPIVFLLASKVCSWFASEALV